MEWAFPLSEIAKLFVKIGADVKDAMSGFDAVHSRIESFGKSAATTGAVMTAGLTVPLLGTAKAVGDVGISFESAFAGVRKTIDATEEEFAQLRTGIRDMAKEIPTAREEIAGVAEAAGQLGIAKESVLGFTRTMVDLGVATNLTAREAATDLARFANITRMPQTEFQNLGSTIVALGNNFATTEREIVAMGMRIAGAGSTVGMTQSQIMGFATALSSVGIEAEAGGTAISRVFVDIANEVASGGKKLTEFAKVAGMSASEFSDRFKTDAAGAVTAFIGGLGRIRDSGENVFAVLEKLDMSDIRVRDALLRSAGAGDLLGDAIALASKAWDENNALTKEAEQRYATVESMLQIAKNKFTDLGITIFDRVRPALVSALGIVEGVTGGLKGLIDRLAEADPRLLAAGAAFLGVLAAAGPVIGIVGALATGLAFLMTPIGLIVAGVALLAAAFAADFLGIRTTVLGFVAAVQPILSAFLAFLSTGSFSSLADFSAAITKAFGPDAVALAFGFATQVQAALEKVKAIAAGFASGGLAGGATSILSQIFGMDEDAATGLIQRVTGLIGRVVSTAQEVIGAFASGGLAGGAMKIGEILGLDEAEIGRIVGLVSFAFGEIVSFAQTHLLPGLMNVGSAIQSNVIPAIIQIGQFVVTEVIPRLAELEAMIASRVVPILTQLAGFLIGNVVPAIQQLAANFQKFVGEILPLIGPAMDGLMNNIATVLAAISAFWQEHWTSIQRVLQSTWDVLKSVVEVGLTLISGLIKTILRVIAGDWEGAWDELKATLEKTWQVMQSNLETSLIRFGALIIEGLKTLESKGREAAQAIGRAIVDGITGALNAGWSKIQEAASGLADAIPSTVKSILGIRSPSRVMSEHGTQVVAGLAQGITSKKDLVNAATKSLSMGLIEESQKLLRMTEDIGKQMPVRIAAGIRAAEKKSIYAVESFGDRLNRSFHDDNLSFKDVLSEHYGVPYLESIFQAGQTELNRVYAEEAKAREEQAITDAKIISLLEYIAEKETRLNRSDLAELGKVAANAIRVKEMR